MAGASAPTLAIIGGRLEPDNAAVFTALAERAGGRIAVLATASQLPHEVGPETVGDFRRHGIDAELVPLFHGNAGTAARDPRLAAQVKRLGSVYFTGGDQSTLMRALAPDGRETPVLAAIRELHARGGLIAGSSAGAAVMSAQMIIGGNSLEAVIHGVVADAEQPGLLLGRGLGLFPHGIVDQHFLQRGRIGRLLVAMAHAGVRFGFGVDENTAMLVDGHMLSVVGETGAIVVNGSFAVSDPRYRRYDDYKVSYLDDGDAYNLAEHLPLANGAKKPARKSAARGFTEPGYLERSVFAPHVFDELLTRLAEGDSARYARDTATSYDADAQIEVTLELKRSAISSDSRVARVGRQRRYSVFDYGLSLRCRAQAPEARKEWLARSTKQLMRGVKPAPSARLVSVGAKLDATSVALLADLRALNLPITVVAAAAAAADETAHEYCALLGQHGIRAVPWQAPEEGLLGDDPYAALAAAPAILLTGGSQERLMRALFRQAEETPLLGAIVAAYRSGGTIIAVGGSSTALASAMIGGGGSDEALIYGTSPDPWYRGVVVQEGIGLFREGMIDQHFISRHRLGRLLVACLDEGARYGFGLPEEAGFACTGGGHRVQAIGGSGMVVLDLRGARHAPRPRGFAAEDVKLLHLKPGQTFDTATGTVDGQGRADALRVGDVLARFVAESTRIGDDFPQAVCTVDTVAVDEDAGLAHFHISVDRPVEAHRAIREPDWRRQQKRKG